MWSNNSSKNKHLSLQFLLVVLLAIGIAGCSNSGRVTPSPVSEVPAETSTPLLPSPTPEPLAAVVNGEKLLLTDFEAELQRYVLAQGEESPQSLTEDQQMEVLNEMIDEILLSQGAVEDGFEMQDAEFQQRLTELEASAGGAEQLNSWIGQHGYTQETFEASLRLSIAAAWERDNIIEQVPESMEQVHVRQILVTDEDLAKDILGNLKSGADFATLALTYDPLTGGDLGWFPKEFILLPEVEEAAFALQPGEFSEIVPTAYGFHILEVVERGEEPLQPEARKALQRQRIQDWLKERREQSQIEIDIL